MYASTKQRYGLRLMIELARINKIVPLRILAKNQDISAKYAEQMAASLKIAGLIE